VVHIVFNPKACCNSASLLTWIRQQFKWGSPYSPSDNEPKLLVIDSFAPYKNSGTKKPVPKSLAAYNKFCAEEQLRHELKAEYELQNVLVSIIPGGGTGYVQPLDISVNKLLKGLIRNQEEEH
jgi:hypothetical protein